ncbi:hypothetical protein BLS_010130 [Venturia inaequalis]|uniref:HTH La-type RNA-binding domain-containing protein n=1 Tax=Venturia inaequalis TaxID=5025 RepID=A0A8H3UJR9_VENIN|nr:hypothetical protein BLS_010130 [Venturia inaequalis]KAE9970935.1 hypothetical protein EG327_010117 [Venturia inaequalis]RDI80654.1 hypothetical protein Vi05172_g9339 [Venturia inaequalis]
MGGPLPIPEPTGDPAVDKALLHEAICRQVDFWFSMSHLNSNEGLRLRDEYIGISKGENNPVPISKLTWWPRLRHICQSFKYKSGNVAGKAVIMEALKNSTTVNIVAKETVQRKANIVDDSDDNDDDGAWDANDSQTLYVAPPVYRPVKKMSEATGWEKNFADAPITPAEHEENLDCYHPDRQVHDRLEVAIQRFKARRKFHTSHSTAFNAWLKFGGVDTGERKFNGKLDDKEKLEGMSAFDKAIEFATHQVGEDKGDPKQWVVDFVGVAEAYLSTEFQKNYFDPDAEQIDLQCGVMTNFYNYLLLHNVCPEYKTEIEAAHTVVKLGRNQLIAIHQLGSLIPGDFNVACSVLLEGSLAGSRGVSYAAPELEFEAGDIPWNPITEKLLTAEEATVIVRTACTSDLASAQLFEAIAEANLSDIMSMDETFELGLEVVEIHRPTEDDIKGYHQINMDELQISKDIVFKPLGKLVCKPWKIPAFVDHDLPKHLRDLTFKNAPDTFTFWVEGDIIDRMFWETWKKVLNEKTGKWEMKLVVESFVGMKMSARVRRLKVKGVDDCLWVLDGVNTLHCAFYNLILNDLMPRPWKEIRLLTEEDQDAKGSSDDDGL